MWRKIKLNPCEGTFLLKEGVYRYPSDINDLDRGNVIGYVLDTSGNYSGGNIIIAINASNNYMEWSKYNGILYNKIPKLTRIDAEDGSSKPYKDKNGKKNTRSVIDFIKSEGKELSNESPAFSYCKSYSPGYKDGEWYLPSAGELKLFFDKRNQFRKDCNLAGITTNMDSDNSNAYYFWSSTECSDGSAWYLNFYTSSPSYYYNKNHYSYVVPFLAF